MMVRPRGATITVTLRDTTITELPPLLATARRKKRPARGRRHGMRLQIVESGQIAVAPRGPARAANGAAGQPREMPAIIRCDPLGRRFSSTGLATARETSV